MKKVKITENELVSLIEKLVKENMGFGNGQNFGMMNTPTAKYQDLIEDEDIESPDELDEDNGEEEQLNLDVTSQPGSDNEDEWMESIEESKLIYRLKKRLNEETTVGCAKTDKGCVRKGSYTDKSGKKYPWHILNNKKDGIWRGCSSRKNCEEQLAAIHS